MPSSSFDKVTRVVKRLAPHQPGALKLARRYGETLVCVRYRRDADGTTRYTTIELIVDTAPVAPKRQAPRTPERAPARSAIVGVRIALLHTAELRAQACALGATWDPRRNLWLMPRHVAQQLGLTRQIIETSPSMDGTNVPYLPGVDGSE